MSQTTCIAVAFLLACAVVQASQGYSVGGCPNDGEPQNGVLLLQTKLSMNLNGGGAKPECILHVGPPKTGTTSLQKMLGEEAVMLQSDGWYPLLPIDLFHSVARLLYHSSPITNNTVWRTFVSWVQARARNRENIVLSSEYLSHKSIMISPLLNVLAEFHTTVVVGYRNFFEWVPSVYRQKVALPERAALVGTLSQWLTPDMATRLGRGCTDENHEITDVHRFESCWLFTDRVVRAYGLHFKDIRVLELKEAFLNTFVCSVLNANRTCASVSDKPEKKENVRMAPTTAGACANATCLDRDVRTILLDRTVSAATEVTSLSLSPLNVDPTEHAQKLDSLGLCFC